MTTPGVFAPYDITSLPAPVTVTNQGLQGSAVQPVTGIGLLIGVVAMNRNATTPAVYTLYDGLGGTGQQLMFLSIPAADTFGFAPCPPGILFRNGLWLVNTSGAAFFTFTYIPLLLQP